ncbi:MAG: hypothetical protein Kow0047_31780 [Anaerolineae bacterium]
MNELWMSSDERDDALEEGYWQSLLNDGEIVSSPPPEPNIDCWWDGLTEGDRSFQHVREHQEEVWRRAEELCDRLEPVRLRVVGYNRGGLLVDFERLQGFVPASHLRDFSWPQDYSERERALEQWIGRELDLCVIEVDRSAGRLILSQRAVYEGRLGQETLSSLRSGEVRRGRVTNIRPFGVFVDLGGVEGLIHISELSWGRVDRPEDVVQVGDEVDVYIISVDREQRKIALSLKRLTEDPWLTAAERYQVGQVVTGVVTNVVSFGAFVRIEEGLEGLIHISELAEGQFLHPRNVVQEGQRVRVRILNIDPEQHRMGLSMRRVPQTPQRTEDEVDDRRRTALVW